MYLLFYDKMLYFELQLSAVIDHLQKAITSGRIALRPATRILFLSSTNQCQYRSFLIRSDGARETRSLGYE